MLEVVCPPEGIQEEPQLPLSGLTYGFLIINCSGVILTIICLLIIQVRDVILLGADFLVIMMMIKTVANDDDVMMIMNETGVTDDQLGRRLRMRMTNLEANDDDGDDSYWMKQGLPTTNLVVTRLVGLLLVVTLFHTIINRC